MTSSDAVTSVFYDSLYLSFSLVKDICLKSWLSKIMMPQLIMHPVYKKIITQSKKFAAHDAENRFKEGDSVRIRECTPVSKSKTFEVVYDDATKG